MNEKAWTEQAVETELAAFRSLSGIGSAYAGETPSQGTLDAVHAAAVRSASRRLFARRVSKFAKFAAVLSLFAGVAWYLAVPEKRESTRASLSASPGSRHSSVSRPLSRMASS